MALSAMSNARVSAYSRAKWKRTTGLITFSSGNCCEGDETSRIIRGALMESVELEHNEAAFSSRLNPLFCSLIRDSNETTS